MLTGHGGSRPPVVSVLGASGFLGGAIVAAVAREPVHVRAVSRRPAAVDLSGAAGTVSVVTADLTDQRNVSRLVAGADAVIVAVAQVAGERSWRVAADDRDAEAVNTGVARAVARACTDRALGAGPAGDAAPVVVFAGSTTQAGLHPQPLTGAELDQPLTAYDRQKLAAEQALLQAGRAGAARVVSLRLPTVFGPPASATATDKGVVSALARRALAGQPLGLWHEGTVERDLLPVADAAAAFTAALAAADRLAGRAWLVGTGCRTPLRRLADAIVEDVAELTGAPPVPVRQVPPPDYASPLDLRSMCVDPSSFRQASDWAPRTGWRAAVRHTVAALHSGQPLPTYEGAQ